MAYLNPFQNSGPRGSSSQNAEVVLWDGLGLDSTPPPLYTATAPTTLPALSANGDGSWMSVLGVNGYINIEVHKTGSGTCTFSIDGTLDAASQASSSSLISPVRYAVLGSSGDLTPIVTATSLGAGTQTVWVTVLDGFSAIAIKLASVTGTVSVQTRALVVPL